MKLQPAGLSLQNNQLTKDVTQIATKREKSQEKIRVQEFFSLQIYSDIKHL
jgi:hypothetical protein